MSDPTARQASAMDALDRFHPYRTRGDEAFDRAVHLVMRDGAVFFFPSATALVWSNPADDEKRWLLVWTEQYGSHAHALAEVRFHGIYARGEFAHLEESTAGAVAGRDPIDGDEEGSA